MDQPIQVYEKGSKRLEIFYDDSPQDPREFAQDNDAEKMVCFHDHYTLGDKHNFSDRQELSEYLDDVQKQGGIVYPLSLYDHSGLRLFIGQQSGWDCGQVGYIYFTVEAMKKNFQAKRITAKVREQACDLLKAVVKEYDQYLSGEVYGFRLTDLHEEENDVPEELESCWGFYGDEGIQHILSETGFVQKDAVHPAVYS
jgi:hypothetical protein